MKNLYISALIFIVSSPCFAENSQILKCRVSNQEWNTMFILDSVGSGFLKFKKANNPKTYTCALKLDFITDGQRAIVPEITVEFTLTTCDPDLGSIQSEILKRQTLTVNLTDKKKPKGRVQWLTKKQPDDCTVEKLSMIDIQLDAKRWHEGNWGRTTASEVKSSKSNPNK